MQPESDAEAGVSPSPRKEIGEGVSIATVTCAIAGTVLLLQVVGMVCVAVWAVQNSTGLADVFEAAGSLGALSRSLEGLGEVDFSKITSDLDAIRGVLEQYGR